MRLPQCRREARSGLHQSISLASVALNVFTQFTVEVTVPAVADSTDTAAIPILIPAATPMEDAPPEGMAATSDTIDMINPAVAAATPIMADVL